MTFRANYVSSESVLFDTITTQTSKDVPTSVFDLKGWNGAFNIVAVCYDVLDPKKNDEIILKIEYDEEEKDITKLNKATDLPEKYYNAPNGLSIKEKGESLVFNFDLPNLNKNDADEKGVSRVPNRFFRVSAFDVAGTPKKIGIAVIKLAGVL